MRLLEAMIQHGLDCTASHHRRNRRSRLRAARRRAWAVETLEGRALLSSWVEQGPGGLSPKPGPVLMGIVQLA
jgi:hypothetical protein